MAVSVAWETAWQVGRRGGCFPDGPLECTIWFRLPMPPSRPKRERQRGWLWAHKKFDIDKLLWSTFDALKDGGLILDDSRIGAVAAGKVEERHRSGPGRRSPSVPLSIR